MPGAAPTDPFTFKIERDPLSTQRFRWIVFEGNQVHVRSPHSYATRRKAESEAARAVDRRAALWRRLGKSV
jgi:hypothetical protein